MNEQIKKEASAFIAKKDEYADIIPDGNIDKASEFMFEFVTHLQNIGLVKINPGKTCTAENCNKMSVGDYSGHGDYACGHHMRKWNNQFDDDYY